MSASEAFAPAPSTQVSAALSKESLGTPRQWAQNYRRDVDCEKAARDLEVNFGHDLSWQYLKGCVNKGGFTQLKMLCDNWLEDLKNRPEAGTILAQVIAARGGHLKTDMEVIQQQRIPLFELSAALKQSTAFKGRYLLVIGKIAETKEAKGKVELVLLEQALGSDMSSVMTERYGSSHTSSGSGSANWKSNGALGSGSASGSYNRQGNSEFGKVETRVNDFFEETGQEIIAKVKQPDPFLRIDKNLVFLVRFDGTAVGDTENTAEGSEPKKTALVTLIAYHEL